MINYLYLSSFNDFILRMYYSKKTGWKLFSTSLFSEYSAGEIPLGDYEFDFLSAHKSLYILKVRFPYILLDNLYTILRKIWAQAVLSQTSLTLKLKSLEKIAYKGTKKVLSFDLTADTAIGNSRSRTQGAATFHYKYNPIILKCFLRTFSASENIGHKSIAKSYFLSLDKNCQIFEPEWKTSNSTCKKS